MSVSSERPNPDLAPLTIAHGRKLFDQGKAIATLLDQLKPLLVLMEEQEAEPDNDPVLKIVELLTNISTAQQKQSQYQQIMDRKLDFLIAHLTTDEQFNDSTE
ncbi:MAG: hypothetical protein EKK42_31750 [Pseudonocardiaceae bacterium]|nr:MAG: hypothetical protein EKK42_31750 [Pseudonocardiaceae bacterium]